MDDALGIVIERSGLTFLKQWAWSPTEVPRRWFSDERRVLGGPKYFYVALGPNVRGPVHHHKGQGFSEFHIKLWGDCTMVLDEPATLYEGTAVPQGTRFELKDGEAHPVFSTSKKSPLHHVESGPRGCLLLAFEY